MSQKGRRRTVGTEKRTRLILARHGETAWNAGEVYRGRADVPLNETGRRQVKALGRALRGERVDAVYSSPLSRAMDTARAAARRHGVEVVEAVELIDISYGKWEGKPKSEIAKLYPALVKKWAAAPETVKFPGGEDLAGVRGRTGRILKKVLRLHEGGTIIFSSHRVPLKIMVLQCLGLGNGRFWDVRIENAAYSVFDFAGGRFVMVKHNECCHLKGIRETALGDF